MKKNRPYVTKWAPANILDTRRTETWLERMAAQGLVYQRQSNWNWVLGWFFCTIPHLFFARFQREAPKSPAGTGWSPPPKAHPSPEQLELYAQSGWQYVDFIDLFYASFLLFCSDDPRAVEPYTDPDSFRLAYRFPVRGLVVVILLLAGFNVLYRRPGSRDSQGRRPIHPHIARPSVRLGTGRQPGAHPSCRLGRSGQLLPGPESRGADPQSGPAVPDHPAHSAGEAVSRPKVSHPGRRSPVSDKPDPLGGADRPHRGPGPPHRRPPGRAGDGLRPAPAL